MFQPQRARGAGRPAGRQGAQDGRCMLQRTLRPAALQLALNGGRQAVMLQGHQQVDQHVCAAAVLLPYLRCCHRRCCGGKATVQQHACNGSLQGRVGSNGSGMPGPCGDVEQRPD